MWASFFASSSRSSIHEGLMTSASFLAPLTALVLTIGVTGTTAAQERAPTANKGSAGATLGYGVHVGGGGDNIYGLGLGAHGGYTLDMNLFVGGFFNYFLGESSSEAGVEYSANMMQISGEIGYDVGLGAIVIRPSIGLGVSIFTYSIRGFAHRHEPARSRYPVRTRARTTSGCAWRIPHSSEW
jgi:hypothetical protein